MAGWGTTPADGNNIPMGCVGVPGDMIPRVLQGGQEFTDANGNITAPARMENTGGSKATYTYAISATAPYATPTDWIVLRGVAGKLIKVMRIEFSGAATAATAGLLTLIKKHTVANTGGTSTSPTPMQHDSNDGPAQATILLYTAAPTINASATIWKTVRQGLNAVTPAAFSATNPPVVPYIFDYQDAAYEPLTLRGVAQECAINFNGVALIAGEVLDYHITWTEE
jgi:hypothetical protein